MISKYILFLILGIDALILFFQTSQVSISYSEAQLLYGDFSFLQLLIKSSISVFGQNGILISPFWFTAEGAIIGLIMGYFATRFGGEGKAMVGK